MKPRINKSLLVGASAVAGLTMGAGLALAAHPPIQLMTYEEIGQQMGMGNTMPVMVDAKSKMGVPYSPKQTCGMGGCHDGSTLQNGATVSAKYKGKALKSYDDLASHAYHASLGLNEWMDNSDTGLFATASGKQTGLNPQKPWLQSHGHNGKW